jgi:hypothetical protein
MRIVLSAIKITGPFSFARASFSNSGGRERGRGRDFGQIQAVSASCVRSQREHEHCLFGLRCEIKLCLSKL